MSKFNKSLTLRTLAGAGLLAMVAGMSGQAMADNVTIFRGAPPSAEELATMMFPDRVSRLGRTRAIVFTNQGQDRLAATPVKEQRKPAKTQYAEYSDPTRASDAPPAYAAPAETSEPARNDSAGEAQGFGFPIQFAFNSTEILPESRPYLDQVGEMLRLPEVADQSVIIEGHTDASGSNQYNQRLSERRAKAVREYLMSRYQISSKRLRVMGKGETELLADAAPTDPSNRRVQFLRVF